jgi:hypothetical protein
MSADIIDFPAGRSQEDASAELLQPFIEFTPERAPPEPWDEEANMVASAIFDHVGGDRSKAMHLLRRAETKLQELILKASAARIFGAVDRQVPSDPKGPPEPPEAA